MLWNRFKNIIKTYNDVPNQTSMKRFKKTFENIFKVIPQYFSKIILKKPFRTVSKTFVENVY